MATLLSYFSNSPDKISGNTPTEQAESIKEKESGKDRLLRVIKPDEFGNLSSEVNCVLQVGCMSMFVGALYGGVLSSKIAYLDFFKNNQATVFKDHLEAKKRLQDKVTVEFGKGAFRWAWRLTLFSTSYVAISTGVSVYRGKCGIIEHVIAGTLTGASYKFNMGPRGWIVGGGLGMALGFIAGGTTIGLLKLSGLTMEEARGWNEKLLKMRTERFDEGVKEYLLSEEMEIMKIHNETATNMSLDDIKS